VYQISTQPIGGVITAGDIINFKSDGVFSWQIRLYHKSGGLKKLWFIGQLDTPIKKIKFELNRKICGAGEIEFAFLDFPIDGGDYIEIYYNGVIKYRALVDNSADLKGGKVKLIPYASRFNTLLINNNFVSKTIKEILETIILENQSMTGINWIGELIDTGETDTYSLDYTNYETIKKVIDELIKKLDDREWGINANNQFEVYELQNTSFDQLFFHSDQPYFSQIETKKDYSKIKFTRYQVFKKTSGSGQMTRIGEVGYGGSYSALTAIENILGERREGKFTASEILSDAAALNLAYQTLISDTETPETITAKDLDINLYFPVIGDYCKFQDRPELILQTIIDCESLTGWSNVTLDTDSVEGNKSVTFDYSDTTTIYKFDFGEIKRYLSPEKIGFMVKSDIAGDYLDFSTGAGLTKGVLGACSEGACSSSETQTNYLFETIYPVYIPNAGAWIYNEFSLENNEISQIGFRFNSAPPGGTASINIDRIQIYVYYRSEYTGNIVRASFELTENGENCSLEAGQYDLQANDELFQINRDIEKIKAVQTA
jgi:hypothetical protein